MQIAAHIEKLRRIEVLRRRLDRDEDFELWYWATLNAGMQAINAALHATGATIAGDYYAHNVPVYFQAGVEPDTWAPAIREFGDLEHVDDAALTSLMPSGLAPAGRAMIEIETVRDPCIRGTQQATSQIIEMVERNYARCITTCAQHCSDIREGPS